MNFICKNLKKNFFFIDQKTIFAFKGKRLKKKKILIYQLNKKKKIHFFSDLFNFSIILFISGKY
jgi:hypothetical protein